MEVPILYTKNVCRDYRSGHETVHALSNVSVEIPKGKLTILRGRSGSGKTTLLNSLGALDFPTSGEIWFEGSQINAPKVDVNKLRQKMGMVFQHFNLFPHLTVLQNITLAPVSYTHLGSSFCQPSMIFCLKMPNS